MSILQLGDDLIEPVAASFTNTDLMVILSDGATLATLLWWYPRLQNASSAQRDAIELFPSGIHWPELDKDLSIEGMLKGRRAPGAVLPAQAAE
jgi:hypothetical protein